MTPALPNGTAFGNLVFLSHAGADTYAARELKKALEAGGLQVWLDVDCLHPGQLWQPAIEKAISTACGMVVFIGRNPVQGWVAREVPAAVARNVETKERFFVIPVLGEEASGPVHLPMFLRQHQCADLREKHRAAEEIRKLIEAIKVLIDHGPTRPVIPAEYWDTHSPFFDLRSFEDTDSWLFFGRDQETEELLEKTGKSPIVAVVGSSGSGKSSLVKAGLVSALRSGRCRPGGVPLNHWRIALFRPGNAPFENLAAALVGLNEKLPLGERPALIHRWSRELRDGDTDVGAILQASRQGSEACADEHVLLVVDQLEELFTSTDDRQMRQAYVRTLANAASLKSTPPVHLVFTVRADFWHYLVDDVELKGMLNASVTVPLMDSAKLGDIINRRLVLAGSKADSGLIGTLLAEASEQPGALPLLEHVLQQLWKRRGPNNELSATDYDELGRLRGALSKWADEIYAGLTADEQELARRILLELVRTWTDSPDTRRRVAKSDLLGLGAGEAVERVLIELGRLISTDSSSDSGGDETVELAHDALISAWTQLREWVKQDRDDLRTRDRLKLARDDWKLYGVVLPRALLPLGEDWLSRHFTPDLRTFIELSRENWREQDRRAAGRLRRWVLILAVCLAVATAGFLFAWTEWQVATSRQLAAQSERTLGTDAAWALQLAVEAYETNRSEEATTALAKAMAQPLPRFLLRNGGDPTGAGWSPDGKHILTWGNDGVARVWSADTGRIGATLPHTSAIVASAFSPDSKRIVTAASDGARLWNAADGRLLMTLAPKNPTPENGSSPALDARFSADGRLVVTATQDGTARLWDLGNWVAGPPLCRCEMRVQKGSLRMAAFSSDASRVVTTTFEGAVQIWNVDTCLALGTPAGHLGGVSALATSPDGQEIAIGRSGGDVDIWNLETRNQMYGFTAHPGGIHRVRFAPDGSRFVTLGTTGGARVWEAETGKEVCSLTGHEGAVLDAAFSPDSTRVATGGEDGSARLWSSDTCKSLAPLTGHTEPVKSVSWSPEGSRLLTVAADQTARVWDVDSASTLATLRGHTNYVWRAAFSPDGGKLITAGADRTARIWDTGTGALLRTLEAHQGAVTQAEFRSDGKCAATAGEDATVRLWDVESGKPIGDPLAERDPVSELAFSADGQLLLTLATNGSARLWDTRTGSAITTVDRSADPLVGVTFSPNAGSFIGLTSGGKELEGSGARERGIASRGSLVQYARWSADRRWMMAVRAGLVQVYDFNLRVVTELPVAGFGRPLAALSSDGRRVVVAGYRKAALWSSGVKAPVPPSLAHDAEILFVSLSPDGKRALTTSEDRTARIWDSDNGHMLAVYRGHAAKIVYAAFSPDGKRIATTSLDNTVRIYASSADEWLAMAKRRISAGGPMWRGGPNPR